MKKTSPTGNAKDEANVWEELKIGLENVICERGIDALEAVNTKVSETSDLIQMYCYGLIDGVRLGMYRNPQKAKEIAEIIDKIRKERRESYESLHERQELYNSGERRSIEADN